MNEIIYGGCDDGYAETKLYFSDECKLTIPSRAFAGSLNQINIRGDQQTVFQYATPEGVFLVGDIEKSDPTNFNDYPISAQNRVIVNHALIQAGMGGKEIRLCSGLPIKSFYRGTKVNASLVSAKRNNLLNNEVTPQNEKDVPARIIAHDVISEGIASWVDYVVDRKNGKLSVNPGRAKQRIAIVDVGGRTTDIAVIRDWLLDRDRSNSIEAGMLKVYQTIRDRIHEDHGVEPEESEVLRAAKRGVIKLWGQDYQVREIVEYAKEVAVAHMRTEVMRRLGDASDIDRVIFVGGGSIAFGSLLNKWFPHQQMGHDPSYCNARGMKIYAELVMADD